MSRKSLSLIAAAALAAVANTGFAQIDGSIPMTAPASGVSTEYGAALALQGTATGYGDNFSELDGAFGNYSTVTGTLNLGLTGNIEGNGNGLIIFIDSRSTGGIATTAPGGFNQLGSIAGQRIDDWGTDTDGGAAVTPTPGGGSILNAGFNPEYALEMNYYAPNSAYYINVIDLTQANDDVHPNKDIYLGQNALGPTSATAFYYRDFGATYAGSVTHALDNSNVDGVSGDPQNVGDPSTATKGYELSMDSDFLQRESGKAVRVLAFISNGGGTEVSNQFLPKMHYADAGNPGLPGGFEGNSLIDVRTDAFLGDLFITLFEPTFTATSGTNWSTTANWTGAFAPNGVEHDAALKGSGGPVNLDTSVVLGTLKFDATANYAISTTNSSTITMNAGNGTSRIDSLSNTNTINPNLIIATDTRISVSSGSTLLVAGPLTDTAGKTITTAGPGTTTISGTQNHAAGTIMSVDSGTLNMNTDAGGPSGNPNLRLFVNGTANLNVTQHLQELGVNAGGRVNLAPRNSPPKVIYTGTLGISSDSVGPTGTLDLNDNDLVVNSGVFADLQNLVLAGYSNVPDPLKTGIISTTGQNAGNTILALFSNADLGGAVTEWPPSSGNTVGANAVIGKYTYFGDANFDGQVTGDDYAIIDPNLNTAPTSPGLAWLQGDMNFDGTITGDDYLVCDGTLGAGVGNPLATVGAAVPEPAALGLLAIGALAQFAAAGPDDPGRQ